MSIPRTVVGTMRVPFLLLPFVCVALGLAAAAWAGQPIDPWRAAGVLLGALAAHASVNMFNEWHDFRSGLDATTQRTPFSGGSGALPADPSAAPLALALAIVSLAIVVAIGLWLVSARGAVLLPLGLAGVILIVAYTSVITHNPYACLVAPGLGFGPLMVVGTHIAVAGRYDTAAGVAGLVPFFLVSALLLLNQFPDVEADREVGRRHLPIAWGRPRAARAFVALYALAYLSLVAGVLAGALPWPCLLGLATLALAIPAARDVLRHPDDVGALLPAMGRNVMVNLATPALVATGLFVG